jgi:hypothetical protein
MDLLEFDTKNYLTTALIALINFYLARFYMKVASYPSGPFPLPVVGNVLSEFLTWILIHFVGITKLYISVN